MQHYHIVSSRCTVVVRGSPAPSPPRMRPSSHLSEGGKRHFVQPSRVRLNRASRLQKRSNHPTNDSGETEAKGSSTGSRDGNGARSGRLLTGSGGVRHEGGNSHGRLRGGGPGAVAVGGDGAVLSRADGLELGALSGNDDGGRRATVAEERVESRAHGSEVLSGDTEG